MYYLLTIPVSFPITVLVTTKERGGGEVRGGEVRGGGVRGGVRGGEG